MLPNFTTDNKPDQRVVNAVFTAKLWLRNSTSRISGANFSHFLGSELRYTNVLSMRLISPTLPLLVSMILCVGSRKKVVVIHAGWVVASVAGMWFFIIKDSTRQNKSNTVREEISRA